MIRGMVLETTCILCSFEAEMANHIFLYCCYTRDIWALVLGVFSWNVCFMDTIVQVCLAWQLKGLSEKGKVIVGIMPLATFGAFG
uniref:Reverse transcriptase zinc-binding domain-containing protein n=1 Tax=Nelumbo nucifera TaxID=4432 RepID=A0A822XUF8_NELNU|nr:TPA_asm: hypothetical protein HUJ06_025085 [Nelumbo nucifera]